MKRHLSEKIISESVQQAKENKHTFCEFLFSMLAGEVVEVYVGDAFEVLTMDQVETSSPAVFIGKFVAAYGECIVLDSLFIENEKQIKSGNYIFIHEKSIKAIDAVDGKGTLTDAFFTSKDLKRIEEHLK